MREHHQWERNHIFNVFLHISLARLRTCASASAGVGKSHGSTRPVAITPRLRNILLFFPPQEICVCSRSCCSSLLFWRKPVLRRSRAELILCSRVLPRLDIVLSPRRKNYDFRLAPPLDSRGYTRRSLRRRPACFDYVDVDAHRIILEAHSSPYT